jgi:predicted nucleotidyltransferase
MLLNAAYSPGTVTVPRTVKRVGFQPLIDRIVKRIVKKFHPEKVILFGSHARGDAGPDSDVDLLVVMDFQGSKLEKMLELRATLNDISASVDILITTPEDFAWRKDVVGTIEWPAFREGKVLYARA